jgi:hypothetical protein
MEDMEWIYEYFIDHEYCGFIAVTINSRLEGIITVSVLFSGKVFYRYHYMISAI